MTIRSFLGLFLTTLSLWGCGASSTPTAATAAGESANRDATERFRRGEQAAEQGDTVRAEQYLSTSRSLVRVGAQ